MLVEVATTDSFKDIRSAVAIDALPESDFTAKALLEDLPAGQDIFYRVRFEDLAAPTISSEAQVGRFRTAPNDRRSVSFVWSGDTAGQGWGIDEARGGMRTYATMLKNRPDFFIHSGDSIYADCPIERELKLPNGEMWKNLVTEEKSRIATTVADYRGNYKYNLLDAQSAPLQRRGAGVRAVGRPRGRQRLVAGPDPRRLCQHQCVAARGARPARVLRIHAGAADPGRDRAHLSQNLLRPAARRLHARHAQLSRAERPRPDATVRRRNAASSAQRNANGSSGSSTHSNATWKIIAADMPLSIVSSDAIAQGDGAPLGRELEIAELLSFIKHAGVRNTVWITADMHYTAAHYYDPNRAVFQDFEPFWEFVSGPIHAGTWGPGELDNTFGPQVMYQNGCSAEQGENLAPCFGLQFFGHVEIDGATEVMTVTLKDVERPRSVVDADRAEARCAGPAGSSPRRI